MGIILNFSLRKRNYLFSLSHFFLILTLLAGCSTDFFSSQVTPSPTAPAETATPTPVPVPQAVVNFKVTIPGNADTKTSIFIDILDEVTGLGLNPARYRMESAGSNKFSIKLPVRVGGIVKYRYVRDSQFPAVEYTSIARQVRYRVLSVSSPMTVEDIVSGWMDTPYKGSTGRISGKIVDATNDAPIPDAIVYAGGFQAMTASDGSYSMDGLPPGVHNLVAMSLDGTYHDFQQGAKVAANSTTPADLKLNPAKMVSITFAAALPGEVTGVPVRLAGDLYSLGETFADLDGGMNIVASRMPILTPQADGKQTIELSLPAGTDLHYLYTLGDGFWNAEHTSDGKFNLRELIVPDHDVVIDDTISTWKSGDFYPITFTVTVPTTTPATDGVSIQFNPYGWTEPIPMWSVGNNKWMYILYSPLNLVGTFNYRYCRNDQCNVADDSATQGPEASGWQVKPGKSPQAINDVISQWAWWQALSQATTVAAAEINPRDQSFVAGVEFQDGYRPSWQSKYITAFQELNHVGSKWVFMTPTWTYQDNLSPIISPVAGSNPMWDDLLKTIHQANETGLSIAVFPQPRLSLPVDLWWKSAPRDYAWWATWFEGFQRFITNFADLSSKSGAKALVIGGDWVTPALPGGKLADGSPSGVPEDAADRWSELISVARDHFQGTLIWALPYTTNLDDVPGFVSAADEVYVLFSQPLSFTSHPAEQDLENEIAPLVDGGLLAMKQSIQKPLILGVAYASIDGSASICISTTDPNCIVPSALDTPGLDSQSLTLDLQSQVDVYNAWMVVVNQRNWIDGFVSRGYYPPAALRDKSYSVHGKPAFDVLWYWFSRLGGN